MKAFQIIQFTVLYLQHRERGELVAHLRRHRVGVGRLDGGEHHRRGGGRGQRRRTGPASALAVRPHKLGRGKSTAAHPTPTSAPAAATSAARGIQHFCRSGELPI